MYVIIPFMIRIEPENADNCENDFFIVYIFHFLSYYFYIFVVSVQFYIEDVILN